MEVAHSLEPARPQRSRITFESRGVIRILIVLAGLVLFAAILSEGVFLQLGNIVNLGQQNAMLLVVAMGQLLAILTGGIDLSVGATLAMSSVIFVVLQDYGLAPALAGSLSAAALIGLANGTLVNLLRLPAFVVTLAMSQIVASLAMVVSEGGTVYTGFGGAQISSLTSEFYAGSAAGIPNQVIFALVIMGLIVLYLRTSYGHFVYAVGGNRRAAFLSGIPVNLVGVAVYALSALLSAVGGLLFVSRVGLGDPQAARWIVLDSIAAISIGGASLSGGVGTTVGTLLGVIILGVLNNIMNLLGVPPNLQPAIKGIVILVAVLLNSSRKGK